MQSKILLSLNKLFPQVKHPFNLEKSYAEWEFDNAKKALEQYVDNKLIKSSDDIIKDKRILDIGAGAAGKSIYYLCKGAKYVCAVDILDNYIDEALEFAKVHNVIGKFDYKVCDGASLPFEDCTFDTVIMNDAFEHVQSPEDVLSEIKRILTPNGRAYINFPPYNHPYGAHLSDTINIPWVHLFFSEKTLIKAYKIAVKGLPDGESRIKFRISENESGKEYFSYINKMTLKRFDTIRKSTRLTVLYYNEIPLRPYMALLAKNKLTREAFVRCAICIFEKAI